MTWNLWGRFGPFKQRTAAIVIVISEIAPDVVLLQECWLDANGAQQCAVLGETLAMHHCSSGGELLFGDWGPTNAVLSRWPIAEQRVIELPALDPTEWGGLALRVLIDGPRGPLLAYCVALDWPPTASMARQHALRHLAGEVVADTAEVKALLVVGGDFNAAPSSDELRMLTGEREPAHPGFVLFDAWTSRRPATAPPGAAAIRGRCQPSCRTDESTICSPVGPVEAASAAPSRAGSPAPHPLPASSHPTITPSGPTCATERGRSEPTTEALVCCRLRKRVRRGVSPNKEAAA